MSISFREMRATLPSLSLSMLLALQRMPHEFKESAGIIMKIPEPKIWEYIMKGRKVVVVTAGVIPVGAPTSSGYIYPREEIEKAIKVVEDVHPRCCIFDVETSNTHRAEHREPTTHTLVKLWINDEDIVMADMNVDDLSERSRTLQGLLLGNCPFRTSLHGYAGAVDQVKVISEYELLGVDICLPKNEMNIIKQAETLEKGRIEKMKISGVGIRKLKVQNVGIETNNV